MNNNHTKRNLFIALSTLAIVFLVILTAVSSDGLSQMSSASAAEAQDEYIYLPNIANVESWLWQHKFGVEDTRTFTTGGSLWEKTVDLPTTWLRLNGRISWRELQDTPNSPIDWSKLATVDAELRGFVGTGVTPILIVDDYPYWAVDPNAGPGGQMTSCAPIQDQYLSHYANFLAQIVERYSSPEFDVHHWEMGNEPDVDPLLAPIDSVYGCYGDMDDLQYYGGDRYGQMLNVVVPAMKNADPSAKIWMGGLLLNSPNTPEPDVNGKPENFLRGVLAVGADQHIDVLPYHSYPFYLNVIEDVDMKQGDNLPWGDRGGYIRGKAQYLRDIMAEYGVDIPLSANETALLCNDAWAACDSQYFEMAAYHLVRGYVRALSIDVKSMMWFTIGGDGWNHSGLLEPNQTTTRPAYDAYKVLIEKIDPMDYEGAVNYGAGVEGYVFEKWPYEEIHVVWMFENTSTTINVPVSDFDAAYDMFGNALVTNSDGTNVQVPVGFGPVYIHINP